MVKLRISQLIRCRLNKDSLELSRGDLETEIIRLYQSRDTEGLLELFEAYKDFELNHKKEATEKEVIELAKRNLDFICEVADIRIDNREETTSNISILKVYLTPQDINIGPIREFYRCVVGYSPCDLKST